MLRVLLFTLFTLASSLVTAAQELPPAEILNEEGGTRVISGSVRYTNAYFTSGVAEPLILLEDQAGFVDRDLDFLFPPESQVFGRISSDWLQSPFEYVLTLPIEPQGTARDVDNDGEEDAGVQIYGIAYWTNIWGPPELEARDQGGGGWSTAYASMRTSNRSETLYEVIGGKYLIYAPDDAQGFPTGFGDDGLLFTEDDPVARVPAGYSVVDLDSQPFTFDRSARPVIDLIEGEGAEADDFSGLGYVAAFDAMIDKFRREYAFSEYKGIDWDAKSAAFRPRFAQAEADGDVAAYELALRDFSWSIPDGHVGVSLRASLYERFLEDNGGGLGIAIRELDDGRVLVNYLGADTPAAQAGIRLRAEILELDGLPIADHISATQAWSAPFSLEEQRRLQQLRYATRFPRDSEVEIVWRNPGEEESRSATLTATFDWDSFDFSSFNQARSGFELPVEYALLPGRDYALVRITDFSDNERLTIDLWERLIATANEMQLPGIIIDMRNNFGGSGWLALQMAAYFFDEPLVVGNSGYYDEDSGDFFFDPQTENEFILPPESLRYDGEVALLVYSSCYSACEFFSYYLTIDGRATIVGQYGTAGAGGSVETFFMPGDMDVSMTIGRAVDGAGEIHLEGIGVVPDVRVPVTEETLFSEDDVVLEAAIAWLDETLEVEIVSGGGIAVGDSLDGSLAAGMRLQYRLLLPANSATDIVLLSADEELDTVLNLYDASGANLLDSNDDANGDTLLSALRGLEPGAEDFPVIVEVAGYADIAAGDFTLEIRDVTEAEEAAA